MKNTGNEALKAGHFYTIKITKTPVADKVGWPKAMNYIRGKKYIGRYSKEDIFGPAGFYVADVISVGCKGVLFIEVQNVAKVLGEFQAPEVCYES